MATRTYTLTFTPHDARSTDTDELFYEIRNAAAGAGDVIASGRATDAIVETLVVVDTFIVEGVTNTRSIRVYDGAANPTDTSFDVEAPTPELDLTASVVSLQFVYEWRDHRYNFIADITPSVFAASVELENDRLITRSARLSIDPRLLPATFDPESDHVAINASFIQGGGQLLFPLGLFRLDVNDEEFSPAGDPLSTVVDSDPPQFTTILDADGADVVVHLHRSCLGAPYTVDANTNIIIAARAVIDAVTLPDFVGAVLPLRHDLPDDDRVLPFDRTWPPEASRLDVVNNLLRAINHYPIYADARGTLRTRERLKPADEFPDVAYTTLAEPRLIVAPFRRERTQGRHPNRVNAYWSDARQDATGYIRENYDPNVRISTANQPIILEQRAEESAPSGDELIAIADFWLGHAIASSQPARLVTMFDPRRTGHETYTLTIAGVEDSTKWRVFGWSLSMKVGTTMVHRIGRAQAATLRTVTP